ncbi:MAG: hypothetical protein ABSG17_24260 [Spirochaetia bacterium]|jgi:outer membrane receptor for Fe3+-dicitrate
MKKACFARIVALLGAVLVCSCSLFAPDTQVRFQNLSTATFNGIELGAQYNGSLTQGVTTDYYKISSNEYTLMTKNGSGAWTPILDQYGNSFIYTLNSGMHYTFSISNPSPTTIAFTLSFLRD